MDWKAAPVWREALVGDTLTELLEDAEEKRFRGEKAGRAFAKPFSICVRRRLVPGLKLETEVIFHE